MPLDLDAVTAAELVDGGQLKWTMFPGKIGAFVAEMDFGTAPVVTAALHDAVDRMLFGYLPPGPALELREACAAWQAEVHGWSVPADDIHPLPDVIRGLELAIEHFSRPGSPVILPIPAYMPFLMVPEQLGRETIRVPLVDDGGRAVYDLDALDAAFAAGGDLVILCNPHNPVGRVMQRDELVAISEVVARRGGRVFADEIHAPLVFPGHAHVPYASVSSTAAGHTVTATSASKAWNLPGLKCAQLIISNDADRATITELGPLATHGASTLGVIANTAAFRAGRPWLDSVLAHLDANRHLLAELLATHLPDVRHAPPEGTYLAWLDCRRLGLPDAMADFFSDEADVVLVDGERCGAPGFVRLNFATTRPILTQLVTQMGAAVAALHA